MNHMFARVAGYSLIPTIVLLMATCLATQAAEPPANPTTPAAPPSHESKYLTNIRQVTSGMVKAGEGYFSPDGKSIIYQAQPNDYPFYQIFTQALVDGKPKRVSTGRGRTTCSFFAPSGDKIIFASSHLDPDLANTEEAERKKQAEDAKAPHQRRYAWDFDKSMDIFEANLDGKILRRLTDTPGYDAEGAYSKDGKQIAFCSERSGGRQIYLMNADGSDVRQLTHAEGYNGGPFISPDGKWVVFRSDRKKKDMLQLYVIGIDGKNETMLTDNNGVNWGPYWHPNAPYLIWAFADHSDPTARPNFDLWLMKYDINQGQFVAGKQTRITDLPAADLLPAFSPDGKQLMWTSTRTADHSSQIFIADFQLPD